MPAPGPGPNPRRGPSRPTPPYPRAGLSRPTAPNPRPEVADLPLYRAGRPAGDDELKLSSNENPFPPLPGVMERAAAALGRVNRYPDAGINDLYDALAGTTGLPADRFAAGTGSVAVLFHLVSAFCGPDDEVVMPWRSFEAYPIAIASAGATAVPVPLRADATHDLDAMAAAVTERTRAVLVCTPNNPTGPVVRQTDLDRLVASVPDDVLVVVDEAYVEFVRHVNAATGLSLLAAGRQNVVVLRTFSKAFGLAGLRVGYAISTPAVAEAIRKVTPPFSVTDLAQAAAVASLESADELEERVEAVVAQRSLLVDGLRAQGWDLPDAQGNFVWLPLGGDAVPFAEAMHPIAVRPFAGEGVRISVGSTEAVDRLLEASAWWRTGR
ncbi:histidinol-phosphate transaminase [Aeromicrobium sp. CTD01-1L150]|uniref:histidinol-phosphate transaminase n=1 Tax=Aeromicrobium sp. CTD01-1L150 TaxID=3341830 RepID=UPI0035C15468